MSTTKTVIADYLKKTISPHYWHVTAGMVDTPTCDEFCVDIASDIVTHMNQYLFHEPTEYPIRVEGEDFSVDVFILDETGVHGIAFWNFDDQVWRFHTDTLVDYNEPNAGTKWKWYYPPFGLNEIFCNDQK